MQIRPAQATDIPGITALLQALGNLPDERRFMKHLGAPAA
jgi:N-acetylglutamate synthase-like GNAT family acetyltransferase